MKRVCGRSYTLNNFRLSNYQGMNKSLKRTSCLGSQTSDFLERKGEMRIRFGKWFLFFYLLASIDRRLRSFLAAGSSTVDLERHPSV